MKKIIYLLSGLFIFLFVQSCDKYTDVHKEYVKEGEIVYAQMPDSVAVIAGKERVRLKFWMYNGVNLKSLIVLWNSRKDSVIIPVKFSVGKDSLEYVMNNLPERNYSFDIYSIDNFGNRSLFYNQFGASYGSFYSGTLNNRRVKSLTLTDAAGEIEWYSAPQGSVYTEVRFTNKAGQTKIERTAAELFTSKIDVKPGTSFEHRSLFLPERESIDTFYTEWVTHSVSFPFTYVYDRTQWSVEAVSDETASDGGGKNSVIDGSLSTYWHSQYDPNIPLPHWIVIDMKSEKTALLFEVFRRAGNTDTKTVEIYLGNDSDPTSPRWILAGTGVYPPSASDKLTVSASSTAKGRYLKLVVPDSYRVPFTNIAEIYMYGN